MCRVELFPWVEGGGLVRGLERGLVKGLGKRSG